MLPFKLHLLTLQLIKQQPLAAAFGILMKDGSSWMSKVSFILQWGSVLPDFRMLKWSHLKMYVAQHTKRLV